ncbi:restriction endonuclease subunit S [Psychrobacter urativorans]|uniref:restriction endonuclease subunit S n=1 Tax=Psychrobacter urativorans TaxID=45610 RepID=UPI001919D54F|nr:restriction endonuclease subunit S [Psychrobacter urativorans]
MAKYEQYAEYKDSGVEWLGAIPSHWEAKRLGQFFNERREKVSDKDYAALSVTMKGIVPQLENAAKSDAGDNRKLVLKNDFVINSRSDRKGSSGVSLLNGSVSLISIVLEPRNISPKFVHHLLRSYPFQEEFYRHGKGIVADLWSTNSSEMKNILIPTIPIDEQNQIASFLDHETAQIDTLIEKQKTLIELLKEKRQAVISHAVAKGLNPDAPMKDSGVEWVETIPEHWKAYKLGYCASVGNGATPSRDNLNFWKDGSISWLNSSKINDVIIHEADQFITPLAKLKTSVHPVQKNDILMAITGEGQTRGRVAICKLDATINQHLACIRITNEELGYEYLYYWLNSNYERIRFESSGAGSTKGAITCGNITSYPVLIPPKKEQQEIVEYLKEKNEIFDTLMNSAEQAIQLMQERRTALISAAVTGKIDVRGWVKPS